ARPASQSRGGSDGLGAGFLNTPPKGPPPPPAARLGPEQEAGDWPSWAQVLAGRTPLLVLRSAQIAVFPIRAPRDESFPPSHRLASFPASSARGLRGPRPGQSSTAPAPQGPGRALERLQEAGPRGPHGREARGARSGPSCPEGASSLPSGLCTAVGLGKEEARGPGSEATAAAGPGPNSQLRTSGKVAGVRRSGHSTGATRRPALSPLWPPSPPAAERAGRPNSRKAPGPALPAGRPRGRPGSKARSAARALLTWLRPAGPGSEYTRGSARRLLGLREFRPGPAPRRLPGPLGGPNPVPPPPSASMARPPRTPPGPDGTVSPALRERSQFP
ncbi:collagen alpha-1(I) chain-like, partial [Nannospalax galili]|uniref:collagen alpha-1(I) chain-like n=1 Tax=Nannospalax galili TaxID=1026970 RepID=UPI00111BF589